MLTSSQRRPVIAIAFIAWAYATSGFPPGIAYGAWLVALYALYIVLVERRALSPPLSDGGLRARRSTVTFAIAGVAIAALIALPSLIPFVQLIRRSGYLEVREATSIAGVYPLSHWRSFIDPERLGNPALKNWTGDPRLGVLGKRVGNRLDDPQGRQRSLLPHKLGQHLQVRRIAQQVSGPDAAQPFILTAMVLADPTKLRVRQLDLEVVGRRRRRDACLRGAD